MDVSSHSYFSGNCFRYRQYHIYLNFSLKLPKEKQKKATNIGLILAMGVRIILLFGISYLIAMKAPWIEFDWAWFKGGFTGQSLILFGGGLFLLYKSTSEIHHKLEGSGHKANGKTKNTSLQNAIVEITVINIIFSFDSILTAVGMTSGIEGALLIMIVAIVISVLIMMLFAVAVGRFVNEHPSMQILGLSFLILIGFMLITEASHLAHLEVFGNGIGAIPKGYLYFAITFSLGVEFLNMRFRKRRERVQLHGAQQEALGLKIIDDLSHNK